MGAGTIDYGYRVVDCAIGWGGRLCRTHQFEIFSVSISCA